MSNVTPIQIPPHDWRRIGAKLEVRCPTCSGLNCSQYQVDEKAGTMDLLCYSCVKSPRVELVGWVPYEPEPVV
jgi:transcription elongation factor Elf1